MKSGVIGLIGGGDKKLESFEITNDESENQLAACVEVLRTQHEAVQGSALQFGRAAIERPVTEDSISIVNGSISVSEESTVQTLYTEFIFIPGQFTVVSNGAGAFAFDMFSNHLPGVEVDRAKLDLNQYINNIDEGISWKVGFYGHLGEAEKGTVYGENVLDDNHMGSAIESCQKNQIGITLPGESEKIKLQMTESGYVEIYQPSNYEEQDFSEFISNNLIQFAFVE